MSLHQKSELDQSALRDLFELDSEGTVFCEVANAFILQLQSHLPKLNVALTDKKSFEQIAGLAHLFKSSSAYIGATKFSQICQLLEAEAKVSGQKVSALIQELMQEAPIIERLLNDEIAKSKLKAG